MRKRNSGSLFPHGDSPHIGWVAKSPKKPRKDPARPTRAKAARPDAPETPDALADLLNPGIGRGTAGLGSGTGLQPPPDNSWDRRRDFSAAHTARKSAKDADKPSGFEEAQRSYTASPITGLDPRLAAELGLSDESDDLASPSLAGGGPRAPSTRDWGG
jgi:excinuclease ABC subunit B